ncbi:hypothetical protein Tco_0087302 [Tanacetum coccineum]
METPLVQEIETKIKEMQQEITALNNQQHSLKIMIRKRREESTKMDQKVRIHQKSQENSQKRASTDTRTRRVQRPEAQRSQARKNQPRKLK